MGKHYPSQKKEDRTGAQHLTATSVGQFKNALDVRDAGSTVQNVVSDAAEASSTEFVINATAHVALVGDRIRFTSGVHDTVEVDVLAIDTNTITLAQTLSAVVGTGDTFDILRPTSLTVNADGTLAAAAAGAIQFKRDGSNQEVTEDTVTPANNRPLPVKLTDFSGDMVLNASNLNLEVQLDHDSANPDSVQVGDGTNVLGVTAANEAKTQPNGNVADHAANSGNPILTGGVYNAIAPTYDDGDRTSLQFTAAGLLKTDATSTEQATAADGAALPALGKMIAGTDGSLTQFIKTDAAGELQIDVLSSALPTGAATEVSLAIVAGDTTSLDAKVPAQGAALTAASLPVNIASDQTVAVSASALPLPTGAATEATLLTIDTDTGVIAGDTTSLDAKAPALGTAVIAASTPVNIASDQTVAVSAASLPLPTGAATEATLATLALDATGLIISGDTTSLDAKTPALGAALIAVSVPVNIASDQTVPVSASSLPLPTGAATEATLVTIDTDTGVIAGDTTSIDGKTPALGTAVIAASVPVNIASDQTVAVSAASLPLPTGAATEATLSALNAKLVSGTDIGDVTINNAAAGAAVNIQDGGNLISIDDGGGSITVDGSLSIGALDVVDFLDTALLDASSTAIPASASVPLTVVASLAAGVSKVQVADTTGGFIGVYSDPAGTPVLEFILGPGSDNTVEVTLTSTTVLGVRNMENSAISVGNLMMNFMG